MSSMRSSDDLLSSRSQSKKRRIPGACDICKRKKIRCDSGEMPGNRCTNCIQYGFDCTHKEVTKTLGSAKGYVESLEARLEKMDKLLAKLLPGVDINKEIENDEDIEELASPVSLPRNDDDDTSNIISIKLSRLRLNPTQNRFFGKSSGYQLVQTALDVKESYVGGVKNAPRLMMGSKRREFWEVPSWITPNPESMEKYPTYTFPDDDLLPQLIDHYFEQINPFLPLLHRPTFENSIAAGLHRTDPLFAATVLIVCALGSRYSDDPRVFLENSGTMRSAGWRWFQQVNPIRNSFFKRTSLHELQMHALYVLFVQSTEMPQGTYAHIGVALRLAEEVGAHRKRRDSNEQPPSAEDELWKRAFWVIASLDRLISSFSGRPCGIHDEDFDQEYPLEVDDEYWDQNFAQPAGKPSLISYFSCYLSLMSIMGRVLQTIYPVRKPKESTRQQNEQQLIAELDSAMNNWMDSIPDHLKWNPNCPNPLFLKQSATLYATYYHLQIFIHRPFIPSPRNPHPATFPSLAICTNAARSCCHVLESYARLGTPPLPFLQVATTFTAAVILLLNIWSGKRSGYAPNPRREMEDVQSCMEMLKKAEERWCHAGRYRDILTELVFAGDLSIDNGQCSKSVPAVGTSPASANSYPTPSSSASTPPSAEESSEPVHFRDRRRSFSISQQSSIQPAQETMNFSLPIYGNELGRLPVYGQFSFSDPVVDFVRDNRDRFPTSCFAEIPLIGQFDPPMHMDKSTIPANLAAAQAFAGSTMFNEPMASNPTAIPQAPQQYVDLSAFYGDVPPDVGHSDFGTFPMMDDDTLTMWSTAPTNFELDAWGTYLSSVGQMTHGQAQDQSAGYYGRQSQGTASSIITPSVLDM